MQSKRSPVRRDFTGKSPRKSDWRIPGIFLPIIIMIAFFNTACSTSTPPPPATSAGPVRYIVTADETAFYKYGPAQANGADMQLKKGREIIMLERHYGYSRVQLEDGGDAGYVPTDDIAPSPHQQALATAPVKKSSGGRGGSGGSRGGGRTPDFEQPNDVALPSAQPPSDEPVPSFRY